MTTATAQQKASPQVRVEPVYVFGCRINDNKFDEGSAAIATRFHGVTPGTWNGPNANGYAIPWRNSEGQPLPLRALGEYLTEFLKYAKSNPTVQFRIARFGCDKDGHKDSVLAPLWRNAPPNCALPAVWQRELGLSDVAKVLIFDPLARLKNAAWQDILRRYLAVNLPLWGVTKCEFLSSGGPRDCAFTANAANDLGYRHREIRADPRYYKEQATVASEILAIWHSTHLLSITDPDQTSVPSHVRILNYATRDGLLVDDLSLDGNV
jgi:hypothetical protein